MCVCVCVWGGGGGGHKAPALTLYIRNKKGNTKKLCEFSKDLYSNNLLVTCLDVSMAIRLS